MEPIKSPFKFLDSFTKEDKEIFFGRDKETEELYHKIFESKILLVYGVSGTGKSSLINCGLVSKFSESDWLPVNVRRGGNIVESLEKAIKKVGSQQEAVSNKQSAVGSQSAVGGQTEDCGLKTVNYQKLIRSLYLDNFKPIYFIFDQFEELFIFGSKSEKEEFIKVLNSVIESDLQCRFLFVIREEYLASITEFEKHIPSILANRVRIEKMTRLNAQQAIEGPCKYAGIEVEDNFSNQLLDRLSPEGAEIELTYLQVYLDKIFREAVGRRQLAGGSLQSAVSPVSLSTFASLSINSVEDKGMIKFSLQNLESIGDVKDLLGSFLEEQIAELTDPDTALVVLKAFVSTKGTKRQVTEDEVLDYSRTLGKDINKEALRELILRFVSLRILRDKDESGRYELRHDALAAKIFEKITVFEKDLLEIRQFIENAFANYEKRDLLLSVADLKYISKYEDKIFLGKDLHVFVNKSKEDIRVKQKVLNRITTLSVSVLLIVFALLVVYFIKQNDINTNRNNILSAFFEETDPVAGFLLAQKTHNNSPSSVTQTVVFNCFYKIVEEYKNKNNKNPFLAFFNFTPCKQKIIFADFTVDGKNIYGYTADSTIYIWENSGAEKMKIHSLEIPINLKISSDSKFISAVFKSGKAMVWNASSDSVISFPVYFDFHNTKDIISFATNKKCIAVLSPNSKVLLYSLESGKVIQELTGHKADVTSVCFSPDERFLATTSKDKIVIIWYFNRKKNKFEEYNTIKDSKDIIWSVQFNSTSNYILTASADSSVRMYKLTGEPHSFYFNDNQNWTLNHWTPISRAEFTNLPGAVLLTRYWTLDSLKKDSICFGNSATASIGYVGFLEEDTLLTTLDFSPITGNAFLASSRLSDTSTNFVSIYSRSYYRMMNFPGVQPIFSNDGKYLLTISGNHLNLFPANINEMEKLIFEKKIFGEIKKADYQKED